MPEFDKPGYEPLPGEAATRRVANRLDRSELLWLLIRRAALVVASLAVLGWVSDRWIAVAWLPPAALVIIAVILLGRALRLEVPGEKNPVIAFSIGLIVVAGLSAAIYAWLWPRAWLALSAVALAIMGVTGIGTRLRRRWRTVSSPAILAAAFSIAASVLGALLAGRSDSRPVIIVYVLSILGGYLAILFGTEPWLRNSRKLFDRPIIRIGGVLAVGAAIIWLVVAGANWYALVILAMLTVITLVITVDGDGEIIAVLILVALAWAVLPRGVDRPDIEDQLAGDTAIIVAMGDSYMSGEGADRYYDGTNTRGENICRRAPTAWPELIADAAEQETTTISLACSGARIDNLDGRRQYAGEPVAWPERFGNPDGADQLTQLAWLLDEAGPARMESVVLTIGGNDAGFSRAGLVCVGPGDCSELAHVWEPGFAPLEERLVELYTSIRDTMDRGGASEVPLLVTGYPIALTPEGCDWTWLSGTEHRFIVEFTGLLNGSIARAAARAGVDHVDTIPDSLADQDLRFCEDRPWRGGLNFFEFNPMEGSLLVALDPRNWVNNSFHPNEGGHVAFADAVQRWSTGGDEENDRSATSGFGEAQACGDSDSCDRDVDEWSRRQIGLFLRDISAPIILGFVGLWLLITPLLATWRGRSRRFRLITPLLEWAESVL